MASDGKRLALGWTDEQRQAITAESVSIALSAGAGCGKTFVLTERFLAELEPRADDHRSRLSQLIAITFTERAAREMRQRIRTACHTRLKHCPDDQVDYWRVLIRDLDSARISTIHSFCASLLRAHAVEAGLSPRFQVLDSAQAQVLLLQFSDAVIRSRLAAHHEATLTLATRFSLDHLREMIAQLLAARQEIDWDFWLQEKPASLADRWHAFWRRDTVPRLLRHVSESDDARNVLALALRYPPDHAIMRQRCDLLLELLPKLADSAEPAAMLNDIREAAKVQGGGTKKNWVSEEVYARFRDSAKSLRETIERVGKCLTFDCVAAEPVAALALQVLDLAAAVNQQYEAEKRQLDALDFNDLLLEARSLLVGQGRRQLRQRVASQIRLLLVDEFQDTDPLQVSLVKALCNDQYLGGKLFLVGDYKQSIYRFRGAQPHVFNDLRSEIPAEGQLPLSLNFRSQPAILDFVNELFGLELGPNYQPLRAFRPQVSPTPAVEFLWASRDDARTEAPAGNDSRRDSTFRSQLERDELSLPEDVGRREGLRRCEADWIARRIRGMLDSGEKIVWDEAAAKAGNPATRAPRPGDFALLFRALTNVEYYEEALRRYGIDYYLVGGHAFYSQQEVYDVLNLLRAINSPCDEVSLYGLLRSPMFGLTDETLFWLFLDRDRRRAGVFADEALATIDEPQRSRARYALKTLQELRDLKDRLPIPQLLHEALQRTGYDAVLLAEFLGERKLANLHKLIEQARSLDSAGIFSLGDFITRLSEFVARQPDEALAATNPESMDVVRLMSIHQSKGLEFPVVIVPDINRPRLAQGPAIAFRRELGPVIKDAQVTTGYDFLMAREKEEDLAELSRLFYVATTRAADYLILSAGVEEPLEPSGPWLKLLALRFDLSTGQANQAKGPDQELSIRVTASRPVIRGKPTEVHQRRDLMKILEKAQAMAKLGEGRQAPFVGAVSQDTTARRQYSFSRLSGKLQLRSPVASLDRFVEDLSDRPQDSRKFGEFIHAVLEEVDFSDPDSLFEIVQRLVSQFSFAAEECREELLAIEMLTKFLASPRAADLAAAREVHRELEFLLAWPPGIRSETGVYLEGFIDCLYRDAAGDWHLLDYKTNRVPAKKVAGEASHYEMQMLVYGLAAERILATPPTELTLCFLHPGVEHSVIWDERARQRAVELVSAALPETE